MRKGFIALLAVILTLDHEIAGAMDATDPPRAAKSESELKAWGNKRYGFAETSVHGNGRALALLGDSGFGVSYRVLWVYLREEGEWRLAAMRLTNTAEIKTEEHDGVLTFRSKAGKVLLMIPVDGAVTQFDPAEQ